MPTNETKQAESLAYNIMRLRKERNMTQVSLAEKLGVTKSIISAYEKGNRTPSLDTVFKMTRVFKVPAYELFVEKDFDLEMESINTKELTNHQKQIIEQMVRGFIKENYYNKEGR